MQSRKRQGMDTIQKKVKSVFDHDRELGMMTITFLLMLNWGYNKYADTFSSKRFI